MTPTDSLTVKHRGTRILASWADCECPLVLSQLCKFIDIHICSQSRRHLDMDESGVHGSSFDVCVVVVV